MKRALILFAACGAPGTTPPDAADCPPPSSATGALGAEVQVLAMTPDPPARFENDWTVAVTTAAGAPAIAADVSVQPFMPSHGHAAPITPVVSETGTAGELAVAHIDLWMPGEWEVRFDVAGDRVTLIACIPE